MKSEIDFIVAFVGDFTSFPSTGRSRKFELILTLRLFKYEKFRQKRIKCSAVAGIGAHVHNGEKMLSNRDRSAFVSVLYCIIFNFILV